MTRSDTNAAGTPRWVKVFAIVALLAVALVVVLLATGGGGHGPGRHALDGDGASRETSHPHAFAVARERR
jgi:hypothetical protein